MKINNWTPALILAAVLVAPLVATAADEEAEITIWVSSAEAGKAEIDASDMAIGEVRYLTTDEGRPVSVTRDDEESFTVDLDGRELKVQTGGHDALHLHGAGDHQVRRFAFKTEIECEGDDCEDEAIVLHGGDGENVRRIVVRAGEECEGDDCAEHEFVWHGDDGEVHEMHGSGASVFIKKICDDDEADCEPMVWTSADGEEHGLHGVNVFVEKEECEGDDCESSGPVIRKRIIRHGGEGGEDGEEKRLVVKVIGEEGEIDEEKIHEMLEGLGVGDEGDGERIEIRVKKKVKEEGE